MFELLLTSRPTVLSYHSLFIRPWLNLKFFGLFRLQGHSFFPGHHGRFHTRFDVSWLSRLRGETPVCYAKFTNPKLNVVNFDLNNLTNQIENPQIVCHSVFLGGGAKNLKIQPSLNFVSLWLVNPFTGPGWQRLFDHSASHYLLRGGEKWGNCWRLGTAGLEASVLEICPN